MHLVGVCLWFLIGFSPITSLASACTEQNVSQGTLIETITELKAKAATTPVRVIVKLQVNDRFLKPIATRYILVVVLMVWKRRHKYISENVPEI